MSTVELGLPAHELEDSVGQKRFLTTAQFASLQTVDSYLRPDKSSAWYQFSKYGFGDETGNLLALYNDYHRQQEPGGWQLWVCPDGADDFEPIELSGVVRTDLAAFSNPPTEVDKHVSFQLGIVPGQAYGKGFNDILNVICRDGATPVVRFFNHTRNAEPLLGVFGQPVGAAAVSQLVTVP